MVNYIYRPILRWKRGEKNALYSLQNSTKPGVKPIITLDADQYKASRQTKSAQSVPAAEHFVNEIKYYWGYNEFYLDASGLNITHTQNHPIIDIANHAIKNGVKLIPMAKLNSNSQYINAVIYASSILNTGAALRIDLAGMTSALNWSQNWPIPTSNTDVVVDFANNIINTLSLGPILNQAFQAFNFGAQCRSVTVASTSMLDNFSGYSNGLYTLPRDEITLWNQVSQNAPFSIDFGDYATIACAAPPANIRWGYPITVKYTLPSEFLICRGLPTTGINAVDMDIQLKSHANSICNYQNRFYLSHCWADNHIDQIALGAESPGNLETWVSLSVNRHIEITRHTLA